MQSIQLCSLFMHRYRIGKTTRNVTFLRLGQRKTPERVRRYLFAGVGSAEQLI